MTNDPKPTENEDGSVSDVNEEQAMEDAQKDAAEEREEEGGYQ